MNEVSKLSTHYLPHKGEDLPVDYYQIGVCTVKLKAVSRLNFSQNFLSNSLKTTPAAIAALESMNYSMSFLNSRKNRVHTLNIDLTFAIIPFQKGIGSVSSLPKWRRISRIMSSSKVQGHLLPSSRI